MNVQMYKLFINNKTVILTNNPAGVDFLKSPKEYIFLDYNEHANIQELINQFVFGANSSSIIIFDKNIKHLQQDFFKCFVVIEAAGGLVRNRNNELLLIYRRGSWDLPKGKIDANESIEAAAIREVQEETGINDLEIVAPIMIDNTNITYHYYENDKQPCLKLTYWYLMYTEDSDLTPQTEEDIEQAIWVKPKDLQLYFNNMYPSIQELLMKYTI